MDSLNRDEELMSQEAEGEDKPVILADLPSVEIALQHCEQQFNQTGPAGD